MGRDKKNKIFGMLLVQTQISFAYFGTDHPESRSVGSSTSTHLETRGGTYGPPLLVDPALSREQNALREAPFPDPMRRELLRGYSAGVTYMDSQLGRSGPGMLVTTPRTLPPALGLYMCVKLLTLAERRHA